MACTPSNTSSRRTVHNDMKGKRASEWLDREWSATLSEGISAENQECFLNSVTVLMALGKGEYVEGWATTLWGPLLHGWVEADSRIIDTTPAWFGAEDDRTYFAARRYSLADVMKAVEEEETMLPLDKGLWSEMVPPDLLHVYLAALRNVYGSEAVEVLNKSNNTPTKKAA